MLKAKKRAYHLRAYDPEHAARIRALRMDLHVEYCQRPEYKRWKRKYDMQYRAKKLFGSFWESALVLGRVDSEIADRMSRYEIMLANGTINKAFNRRRTYENQTGRTHRH